MRLKEFLFGEHYIRHEMDDAVPGQIGQMRKNVDNPAILDMYVNTTFYFHFGLLNSIGIACLALDEEDINGKAAKRKNLQAVAKNRQIVSPHACHL
jgi:hypothetical protein